MEESAKKILFWSIISVFALFALLVIAELSGSDFFPQEFFGFKGMIVLVIKSHWSDTLAF